MELIFEVKGSDERLVLSCRGQLVCGHEADALRATVNRLLVSARHITLDLRNVRKMDCAGLGAIVACTTAARQQGKTVDLGFVPDEIWKLIKITGMDLVLQRAERTEASRVGVYAA